MRGRGGPRLVVPVEEPYRINHRIRVPEVRVIVENEEGEEQNLGVMATPQAMRMAEERDLDLVEVAPQAQPPVCKIMDYGRFKYSVERKAREAKRAGQAGRAASEMKDVQLSRASTTTTGSSRWSGPGASSLRGTRCGWWCASSAATCVIPRWG